jgi:membrane protease YdiL (CAAX protease family)
MITAVIRRLPAPMEWCVVVLACFWWGIYASLVEIAKWTRQGIHDTPPLPQMDGPTLIVALLELLGLAVTFWIARTRGWSLEAWGFRPSWKLTGAGIVLYFATNLVVWPIMAIGLSSGVLQPHLVSHLSVPVYVLFVILNPFFEETIETGYLVQSLQRYGMWRAVLASAFLRTFLHAYTGFTALVFVFPIGLIFGFVYWKWRRLWPLFISHMLFDMYAIFPGHAA